MITVYTKPDCSQCDMTKFWLEMKGFDYTAVDVTQDPAALAAVQELGYLQAPVVVIATAGGDVHWSGFQPERLVENLMGRAA